VKAEEPELPKPATRVSLSKREGNGSTMMFKQKELKPLWLSERDVVSVVLTLLNAFACWVAKHPEEYRCGKRHNLRPSFESSLPSKTDRSDGRVKPPLLYP